MISGFAVHDLLGWFLSAFFIVGAFGNWLAPSHVRGDYARWGYPDRFHRVTAILELLVAILLALASTRLWGVGLGLTVMLAALATLLRHREFRHAIAPLAVILFLLLPLWLA